MEAEKQKTAESDKEEKPGSARKRGLGRGLSALFEDDEGVYPQHDAEGQTPGTRRRMVGVDQLEPGQYQPRQLMPSGTIDELAQSIAAHGVLQPLLVREKKGHTDYYEIIAGERRWRAAQKAQLHEVPVIVRELTDAQAAEIALIENLQREDLNAIDEALGYRDLMKEFGHTQEKLAAILGKSRSHVANMLRLTTLPPVIQALVRNGAISAGHARALVTAENPALLAKRVIAEKLSVRDTEKLAAMPGGHETGASPSSRKTKAPANKDSDTLALERQLTDVLGMKVAIELKKDGKGGRSGTCKIEFKSLDQLDEIISRLSSTTGRF